MSGIPFRVGSMFSGGLSGLQNITNDGKNNDKGDGEGRKIMELSKERPPFTN